MEGKSNLIKLSIVSDQVQVCISQGHSRCVRSKLHQHGSCQVPWSAFFTLLIILDSLLIIPILFTQITFRVQFICFKNITLLVVYGRLKLLMQGTQKGVGVQYLSSFGS
jgi:hypothetical protein